MHNIQFTSLTTRLTDFFSPNPIHVSPHRPIDNHANSASLHPQPGSQGERLRKETKPLTILLRKANHGLCLLWASANCAAKLLDDLQRS